MTDIKITDRFILIENFDDEEIIINDNKDFDDPTVSEDITEFKNKILLVKNCANLKAIKADSLNLTGLVIDKCPQLEHLSVYNNRIKALKLDDLKNLKLVDLNHNQVLENIYLAGCESLQELYVSNNNLKDLDLTDNNKLRILYCSYNKGIKALEVKHLKELKTLHCESCHLAELDCSDLEKLTDLSCFDNTSLEKDGKILGLTKLNLNNCPALEVLDCAENKLKQLLIINHPNLLSVSCKQNVLESLIISNCPKLEELNFSRQDLVEWKWEFRRKIDEQQKKQRLLSIIAAKKLLKILCLNSDKNEKLIDEQKKLIKALINSNNSVGFVNLGSVKTKVSIDKSSYSNLEKISFTEGVSYFNPEGILISCEDFPSLKEYGLGTANDPAFEEYLDKKRQAEWERDNLKQPEERKANTIHNCNYRIPEKKEKFKELELSQRRLTGKLIIEDWPNLKFLNLGDNRLQALVIKNCPDLRKLIYAHNAMPKEAEISGCDNLTEIDNYRYDEFVGKDEEPISKEERAYIEEQERKERQQEDEGYESEEEEIPVDKINYELTTEYLDSLTYEELLELDKDTIPRDLIITTAKIFTRKFKEKWAKKETKNLQKINNLVTKAQKFLKKGNLKEVDKVLAQIKSYCNTDSYKKNQTLIRKLEQSLNQIKLQQAKFHEPTNYSFIISFSVLSVIALTLLAKILHDKIKSYLNKLIKFN